MNIPLSMFEQWLRNKNLKERTIENYIYYLNKFTFDRFNQESVSRFLSVKANMNSVARSFLVNLRKFLMVNRKELGIGIEYYEEIVETELPKLTGRTQIRLTKPLTNEQIQLLEKHLDTEKLRLQLLISFFSGLRLGEMLKIRILSFNWEEWKNSSNKMGQCRVYGKGDKEGIALIPPFLMRRIAKYIRDNNFSNINSRIFAPNEKVSLKNQSRIWQMKLRKAGIDSGITPIGSDGKPIHEESVHPHRLRHSYAYYLRKKKNLDYSYIKEALRHSSIQSTQVYTRIDKEELEEKIK